MREKNRKPIASYIKLPQFTTMNVIDGQAGLIIYASLIFYSLTIDNILNTIIGLAITITAESIGIAILLGLATLFLTITIFNILRLVICLINENGKCRE